MSLFGSTTVGADNRRLLLTIRAGRMYRATSTDNLIHPDPRSGILSFTMEASGVIDMKWETLSGSTSSSSSSSKADDKDKNGNTYPANESLVIMPGGAKFERVTKCTTGRVFVIDLDSRQMFYWLQEQPDKERDENYFKAIKHAIEGKTRTGGAGASSSSNAATRGASASSAASNNNSSIQLSALQNILTNLGGSSSATTGATAGTTTATTATTPSTTANNANPSNNAAALSNLMSQMQANRGAGAGGAVNISIDEVIRSEPSTSALRADPAFYMSRLFDQLPPGTDPADEVYHQIQNPQVFDSAKVFDAALQDPNGYTEIMNAFGIRPPQGVPASSWGLVQAILNEKPQEKNKAGDDAAPTSNENAAAKKDGNSGGGNNNDDAASS